MAFVNLFSHVSMAIVLAAMVHAANCEKEIRLSTDGLFEDSDVALDIVEHLQELIDSPQILKVCGCPDLTCQCCVNTHIPKVKSVCVMLTLDPQEISVSLQLTANGRPIITKNIPVKEPHKVCIPIPSVPVKVCLGIFDVNFDSNAFHGCFKLSIKTGFITPVSIKIGCLNVKLQGSTATAEFYKAEVAPAATVDKEL